MKKWNLIVDVASCHNCNNCFVTCKDEYVGNDFPGYSAPQPLHGHKWINILTKERGRTPMVDTAYLPTMCNHCDNAPCVDKGQGAVTKRSDGIVIIDPQRAVGRKDLVDACPYGAIWWNEELNLPQAWTFDAHLLDNGWSEPRCAQSCPTQAMRALKVSDDEMTQLRQSEQLQSLSPELGTRPRVHYKNLHRYTEHFIGGALLAEHNGVIECAANVMVELRQEGAVLQSTVTEAFGEFKFDALPSRSGNYAIHIAPHSMQSRVIEVALADESVVLDEIVLDAGSL